MEKIFQILIVFVLLMIAVTWLVRGRERKYREYSFSGRFTFPLSGDLDLLTAVVTRPGDGEMVVSEARAGKEESVVAKEGDLVSVGEERVEAGKVLPETAVDAENHLFFRRGGGKTLEIVDEANGVLAGKVSLDWEADAILFDPLARLIFCGSMEGAVTIIRQFMPDQYKIVQRLGVPKDCTALSLDPHNGKLYVHVGTDVSVYTNG